VNEIDGLRLVRQVFPQKLEFQGEAILQFVESGVYRKHRKATGRG
jgi:hypothetical protein